MEIGKTQKFDLKEIAVRSTGRSELSARILGLEVGEGFVAKDLSHSQITYVYTAASRAGRKMMVHQTEKHNFRIVRVK